ncbi:TPA: hypothetical protein EYP45_03200 [Candidatus Peregrinibacteria bacterium]|nr:hypothetical protein [Candidatus Peregrinibacteria bacterium]
MSALPFSSSLPDEERFLPKNSENSKNPENSEISGILSNIDQQKNNIVSGVGNIGYVKSIDIWEQMREECTSALKIASSDLDRRNIQEKIIEIQDLEISAFSAKITETLQESSWKESQEIYTSLLAKLQSSTLQEEIKQNFFVHLSKNLKIADENIHEKEFIEEQEQEENKILKMSSYKTSIPKWKEMIQKYENEIKTTSLQKYKDRFQKKIIDLQASLFLAETYTQVQDAKNERTGKNWKDSVKLYKKLQEETGKIAGLKEESRTSEKSDLLEEISESLKISEINSGLKEQDFYLLKREENLLGMGYRDSKNGWKKTRDEYRRILLRGDLPEKYREMFTKKAKEMDANFEVASFHEELENQKESGDSWEISERKYRKMRRDVEGSKKISKVQKYDILAKTNEYIEISEANTKAKNIIEKTEGNVSHLLKLDDWEESQEKHKDLKETLQKDLKSVDENLLDAKKSKEISEISEQVDKNIKTCTQELQQEKLENSVLNQEAVEKLCAEHPKFAYVYTLFLAVQFQKTDPKILEKKSDSEENGRPQEYAPTEISPEQIQQQKIQEIQASPYEKKTHTIDISDSGIKAISDVSNANTVLENSIKNSTEISLVDAEIGVMLNSPESQNERFAKALLMTLPPEISRNFRTSQCETFLSQKSQDTVLKSQIID